MSGLEARNLDIRLGGRLVLKDVTLRVEAGGVLGLIGPNGAGKSTLARALAGLVPTDGRVTLDGVPIERVPREARARRIAYLAQERDVHWPIPVRELVALGRLPWGDAGSARGREAIERAIDLADLGALADRPATRLSGGERARVLLARALAGETPILLADEPAAALDPEHQLRVLDLTRRLAEGGTAVIVVLHDLAAAARHCRALALLDGGRLVAEGPPEEILTRDVLAAHYHVEAIFLEHEGIRFPFPRRALGSE